MGKTGQETFRHPNPIDKASAIYIIYIICHTPGIYFFNKTGGVFYIARLFKIGDG
jgi:hypothetical protein